MRVLLAEDDRTIGELMEAALTDGSYRVDSVLDGDSARSGFETHTNDVVVLDRGLPKKNGAAVLGEARMRNLQVPVLAITACGAVDERVQGLDDGVATTY
jgi:two-component system OmpR family response regulator